MNDDQPPLPDLPDTAPPRQYDSAHLGHVAAAVREMKHPTQIGPYHILQLIGEGGMGMVYKAEQRQPIHRTVAVKIIKLGMDTNSVIARFESERQALAMMNHPNVAKVLDAGATDTGRPYFVMEHVPGEPITAYADRHKLTIRQRLELFIQACEAVQHAHQKAIIHRDLKPTNILVTEVDGKPQVKVIDFGIAKATGGRLTERTLYTESGQLIGTPEYMSPEQAEMSSLDVDTRSDVYALGVVLYELLTGALPFDAKTLRSGGYEQIQKFIRDIDPPRPSTRLSSLGADAAQQVAHLRQTQLDALGRTLRTELEWIPLKAMHKERARRYASATELAEDIQSYLENRPLRAAPDSAAYRLRKFLRRNKTGVAAAAVMLFFLLAGAATTAWQAIRATHQRDLAIEARKAEAEAREYEKHTDKLLLEMFTSIDPEKARGRPVLVRDILDQAAQRLDKQPPEHGVVEGYVRKIFGSTYLALGLPELARAQLERAVAVDPYTDAAGPLRRASVLSELGMVYTDLGKLPEAEATLRKALAQSLATTGADHKDTIATQSALATVLIQSGKLEEAATILSDAFERSKRVQDIDMAARLSVINNLGTLRVGQGRFPEAEALYRDALKQMIAHGGEDHPHALALTSNLVDLLRQQGKAAEAIELQAHAIEMAAVIFGPDHPDTLTMMNNYALGLDALGRLEDAGRIYLTLIQRAERALGQDHPLALLARSNYGLVLMKSNRLDEAEKTFVEIAPRMKQANGADHRDTILAEANLAQVRILRGDMAGAETIFRDLVPRARRALGATHPAPVVLSMRYGELLSRQHKWADAEPFLADAYEGVKSQGIDARIANAATAYGVCLVRLGKYDQAAAPLRDAYQRLTAPGIPPGEPLRAVLSALIELSRQTGQPSDAARFGRELEASAPRATQPATTRSS